MDDWRNLDLRYANACSGILPSARGTQRLLRMVPGAASLLPTASGIDALQLLADMWPLHIELRIVFSISKPVVLRHGHRRPW